MGSGEASAGLGGQRTDEARHQSSFLYFAQLDMPEKACIRRLSEQKGSPGLTLTLALETAFFWMTG